MLAITKIRLCQENASIIKINSNLIFTNDNVVGPYASNGLVYQVGSMIDVINFNRHQNDICSTGIHFFENIENLCKYFENDGISGKDVRTNMINKNILEKIDRVIQIEEFDQMNTQ